MPSRNRSLAALCGSLGITNTQAHNAAGDATAAATALLHLLRIAGSHGHSDIGRLLASAGVTTTANIAATTADGGI